MLWLLARTSSSGSRLCVGTQQSASAVRSSPSAVSDTAASHKLEERRSRNRATILTASQDQASILPRQQDFSRNGHRKRAGTHLSGIFGRKCSWKMQVAWVLRVIPGAGRSEAASHPLRRAPTRRTGSSRCSTRRRREAPARQRASA